MIVIASLYIYSLKFTLSVAFVILIDVMEKTANIMV